MSFNNRSMVECVWGCVEPSWFSRLDLCSPCTPWHRIFRNTHQTLDIVECSKHGKYSDLFRYGVKYCSSHLYTFEFEAVWRADCDQIICSLFLDHFARFRGTLRQDSLPGSALHEAEHFIGVYVTRRTIFSACFHAQRSKTIFSQAKQPPPPLPPQHTHIHTCTPVRSFNHIVRSLRPLI